MRSRTFTLTILLLLTVVLLAACGGGAQPTTAPTTAAEPTAAADEPTAAADAPTAAPSTGATKLGLWTHSAGNEGEMKVIQQMVDDFNAQQSQYEVAIEAFPQASYNDSVAAASVAGSLPCIIDLDQPTVPNFAWSGYIRELPVPEDMLSKFTPGGTGVYMDKVYSLGQFDVALLHYARKSVLEKYDIRIPTLDEPWTLDEFNTILKTLKDSGEFDYALDVNAQWTGEWWSYAYAPMLQSFGGDLIDRTTYTSADGVLNGAEALAWASGSRVYSRMVTPTPNRPMTSASCKATAPFGTPAVGRPTTLSRHSATMHFSCRLWTLATTRRSARPPGNGASARPARLPMAPGSSSST